MEQLRDFRGLRLLATGRHDQCIELALEGI